MKPNDTSKPQLTIEAAVLDRFRDVLRQNRVGRGEVGDRATDLKHPNKELLYVEHEFEEFVPQVIVGWEELATIGT